MENIPSFSKGFMWYDRWCRISSINNIGWNRGLFWSLRLVICECSPCKNISPQTTGGFKHFSIFTPNVWGNDSIWLAIFFKWIGEKPPTKWSIIFLQRGSSFSGFWPVRSVAPPMKAMRRTLPTRSLETYRTKKSVKCWMPLRFFTFFWR